MGTSQREGRGSLSQSRHHLLNFGALRRLYGDSLGAGLPSFRIERHGAMGVGSTRAELQDWRVDLDRKTAQCERGRGYRLALPRPEGVRIEPIARELADSIIAGGSDQRLKWQGGETVRVLMTRIFPYGSGYMQMVTGRRKRLREALEPLLTGNRWLEIRRDVYCKADTSEAQE
jgi:hypothetical protein